MNDSYEYGIAWLWSTIVHVLRGSTCGWTFFVSKPNILYTVGTISLSRVVCYQRQMAYSTENYGLLKFEKLQNCCSSSDITEARLLNSINRRVILEKRKYTKTWSCAFRAYYPTIYFSRVTDRVRSISRPDDEKDASSASMILK